MVLKNRMALILLIVFFGITAATAIGHIWYKAYTDQRFDNERWGLDYYPFWYSGHFFWQKVEPYSALSEGRPLPVPQYLKTDGSGGDNTTLPRKFPSRFIPASAPLFLVLAPLSLLPWVAASIVWGAMNVVFAMFFVWIIARMNGVTHAGLPPLFLLAIFLSLIATRQVIELGQTSLIVSVCMFAAFMVLGRSEVLGGMLLGLAMSKYTLAFPIFLYFLYCRRWKGLCVCLAVQIIAVAAIAVCTWTNPVEILSVYFAASDVVLRQTQGYCIHLLSLGWGVAGYVIAGLATAAGVSVLLIWFRNSPADIRYNELSGQVLVCIGLLWSLLVLYHGRQDMVVAFLFPVLFFLRVNVFDGFSVCIVLRKREKMLLGAAVWLVLAVWIFPLYILMGTAAYRVFYSACNVLVFIILFRFLWLVRSGPAVVNGEERFFT